VRKRDKLLVIESANKRLDQVFIESKVINEDDSQTQKDLAIVLQAIAQEIPQTLNNIAQNGGDKDGELDIDGEGQNEGYLPINEEYINEVAATLFGINLALNAPSIITLAGKITKGLGSIPNMNIEALKKAGTSLEGVGKNMQGKYTKAIAGAIKKLRPDLDDVKAEKVAGVVFMTLLATVAISTGFVGGVEGASTALGVSKKAVAADRLRGVAHGALQLDKSQILDYSKKLIPAILGKIFG
jgi:hypothetical protein